MNWDQIEDCWAAMTRRVRPDWPGAAKSGNGRLLPLTGSDGAQPEATDPPDQTMTQRQAPEPIQSA